MAAILRIFAKNGKNFAYLLNRAIPPKQGGNLCHFPLPKMAAILNFRIFPKNGKT